MPANTRAEPGDFREVTRFLYALRNRGSRYGLERMTRFAEACGHPERAVPCIHVAGTNGKGSVCALIEAALRAGGFRTGLYTSPHLIHPGERIQVDRVALSEEDIMGMTAGLRGRARSLSDESDPDYPSFFEFMTMMAFRRFASVPVDCAVLEVGLGGRLDATNVVVPEVSVITSIGLDHMDILGDTLEKIATEKAGIIKPGVPVVMGRVPPEAEEVIRSTAEKRGAPLTAVTERFAPDSLPETNLCGGFQRWNAATARTALETVAARFPLESSTVDRAFRHVEWAGRWEERTVGGRMLLFDCTHNAEGARELDANLRNRFGEPRGDVDVIVGSLGLERARAVLAVVAPFARRIHLVRPSQPRARSFREMRDCLPSGFRGEVIDSVVESIFPGGDRLDLPAGRDPVLLTGSVYLIGEVLARLLDRANQNPDNLQDRIAPGSR